MILVRESMPVQEKSVEDAHLIHLIKVKGDVQAFRTLYDKYSGTVLGFVMKMTNNRSLAEEIAQETFWRVWHNAPTYNASRGTFTSWMFGIARNLSIDAARRYGRVSFQPLFDESDREVHHRALVDDGNDVVESVWKQSKQIHVREAILGLPEDQRNVVIWIYFEGKTRREIAAEHNIPLGTVNTRARLALSKLQDALTNRGLES